MEDDESRRLELFSDLGRTIGERSAATLMASLPPGQLADLATRQDLEVLRLGVVAELRSEMLHMTHRLYFAIVTLVLTIGSLFLAGYALR